MSRTHGAVLSGDYRYALWRIEDESKPLAMFVMLNPSTADAEKDDPTIRRCRGFAKAWGLGGILVGNLFALRSTDPKTLLKVEQSIGPENDRYLVSMSERAKLLVAAWGANVPNLVQVARVMKVLERKHIWCLGCTRSLAPRHPLYVPKHVDPMLWPPAYTGAVRRPRVDDDQFATMLTAMRSSYRREH